MAYLSRGARFWLATRALMTGVFLLAGTNPLQLSTAVVVELILLSVVLAFVDTYRHHERALIANLGIRPFVLVILFAAPALIGEVALWLGAGAFS
ncbi:MAG: hypothetical protein M3Q09_06050 [Gemmatimonadota bacterium]|nr:hypothetical protein [Gemmatimonadota bacterium]